MISIRVGCQFDPYWHIWFGLFDEKSKGAFAFSVLSVSASLRWLVPGANDSKTFSFLSQDLSVAKNIHGNLRDAISRAGGAVESVALAPPCACGEIARADNQTPA